MGIALMPYVKHDLILGRFQHPMQRHRQLHHTQVRGQMAPCMGNRFDEESPDLGAELDHLPIT